MTEPQNTKQELPREVFEAIRRIEDIGGSISAQAYAYRETVTDNLPLLAKDILRLIDDVQRREKCFAPSPRLPNKSDDILIEPLRKKHDSHRNDPRICLLSGAGKPLSGMRSVMLRVQVRSFARPATWRHRNSTPVSGSRHACEISFSRF